MIQIIRCKLERWGGKGGDMKVVLTMSKRFAGLIAQIPEDGDILLKPLQLQPELPMFNAVSDDDRAAFEEAELAAGGDSLTAIQFPDRSETDGNGRDPARAQDWFDLNEAPARCDFCKEENGVHQLRRWKDPEMPQGFWCRKCGLKEKIIDVAPPTRAYELNIHKTKCGLCGGPFNRGELRRWQDVRVAYTGWWCDKCSGETMSVTPWEREGPALNWGEFEPKMPQTEETANPFVFAIEQGCHSGFYPYFQDLPEGTVILEPSSAEHRREVQRYLKIPGPCQVPREHLAPYVNCKWACKALARLDQDAVLEQEAAASPEPGEPEETAAESSTRGPETGLLIDFDPERVIVNIDPTDCEGAGGDCECSDAPTGTLRAFILPRDPDAKVGWWCEQCGEEMNKAGELNPWARSERVVKKISWFTFRTLVMGEAKYYTAGEKMNPLAVITKGEPGSKEHREAVKAAIQQLQEVASEDLEPYIMRKWAAEEIAKGAQRLKMAELLDAQARARHAEMEPELPAHEIFKRLRAEPELPTDGTTVGELKHLEPGTENHRKAVRLFLADGAELDLAHLAPYVEEPWAKEEMGSSYNAAKKAAVHPDFPPDDWEIQGHKRALLEKGPGSEEHRSAVRILLSHGEAVSFDNLVHYVDEPWAREEMGRERYQAARDLAAAKKLTKRVEAEENSYECRVCRVMKSDQVMEQYFIDDGEGRYVCHECLGRLGIKSEDVPKAFTEEVKCHQCYRLMPEFVMKEGAWVSALRGEFFCPDCHQSRSESRDEQHA
ncbi:hypothetical protein LCGC14_1077150 [marine sediment metagenome]|uniref:Uncharacterized protein n=1 Tax=marine sediment metagenome TaxID=412755 RepID=A0A0F9MLA7_9ZZZZ